MEISYISHSRFSFSVLHSRVRCYAVMHQKNEGSVTRCRENAVGSAVLACYAEIQVFCVVKRGNQKIPE